MCPSIAIYMKTLEEVWSGHPPSYDRLRVFGCVAYAHIRKDKLQPRAIKCMFLGYPQGVKGYRLWCLEPEHKRCIISHDVVFNESEMAYKTKATAEDKVVHASSEKDSIEVELNEENHIDQSEIWHKEESNILPQIDDDDDGEEGEEGYLLA